MLGYRSVCTAHAGAALLGGLAVATLPGPMLGAFGLEIAGSTVLVGRMFGAILFALGGSLLVAREITDRRAQMALMIPNALCDAFLAVGIALEASRGQGGLLLWGLAALFGVNMLSWLGAMATR